MEKTSKPSTPVAPAKAAQQPFFQSQAPEAEKNGEEPVFFPKAVIQPQLRVGAPDDPLEREADSMAERVMRLPQSPVAPAIQRADKKAEELQRKEGEEKEPDDMPVRRKTTDGSGGFTAPPALASALPGAKGGGASLPDGTRSFMESAFKTDFSGVRVHHDAQSAAMNESIRAKAFTHGSDVYFNQGQYAPESGEGKKLLAHELTHVVQQGEGVHRQPDWGITDLLSPFSLANLGVKAALAALDWLPKEEREAAMKALVQKTILGLEAMRELPDFLKAAVSAAMPPGAFLDPTTIWPFVVSGAIGFFKHLNTLSGEKLFELLKKPLEATLEPSYYGGIVVGIFQGIGGWFSDLWGMIVMLGEFAAVMLNPVTLTVKLAEGAQKAWDAAGVAAKWIADNQAMLWNLLQDKSALLNLKNAAMQTMYSMVEGMGASIADAIVKKLEAGAYEMGKAVGYVVGYIIPEIVLAVGTEAIGNAIKGVFTGLKSVMAAFKSFKATIMSAEAVGKVVLKIEQILSKIKGISIFEKGGKFEQLGTKLKELLQNLMKVFSKTKKVFNAADLIEIVKDQKRLTKFVSEHFDDLIDPANKKIIWEEMGPVTRGKIIEEIFSQSKYKKHLNLNELKPNFKDIDFTNATDVVSFKTYKPYGKPNINNLERSLDGYASKLKDASIQDITKPNGTVEPLSTRKKVLEFVVNKGEWNAQELEAVRKKISQKHALEIIITQW